MWVSLALLAGAVAVWARALSSRLGAALASAGVAAGLLLLVTYAALDRLTGSGIDASVIYHLQTGLDGAGVADFSGLALATAGAVLAVLAAGVLVYRLSRTRGPVRLGPARQVLGLALLAAGLWLNPAVGDLTRLVRNQAALAAAPAGPPPEGFVPVERLDFAGRPRNLVLLYLESVERSYLDETRFPGLMPNLATLEREAVSFTDLTEVEEASWTIAGMVASQCGMPLIGSGSGMDRFLPAATCLGDLLKASGYALAYVGGADTGFAGKGTFYDSHGFDQVEGRAELEPLLSDPAYVHEWGLYDDSLYPVALERLRSLAAEDRPFGLALLTLDTHHPFGFPSASCAEMPYGDGTNQFLNAVHCADRLAGAFIRQVRADPALRDMVLVVASDHMAMPNLAQELLEAGPRRNLLMIFDPALDAALVDTPGTTLDIGPTVLTRLGAPTPALGFGRDLLGELPTLRGADPDLPARIAAARGYLAALWSYPSIRAGLLVDAATEEIVLDGRRLKYPVLLYLNEALDVTGIGFELHSDMTLPEVVATMDPDRRFVWVDSCRKTAIFAPAPAPDGAELCALAGSLESPDLRQFVLTGGEPLPADRLTQPFTLSTAELAFHDSLMADLTRRRQFAAERVVDYTPPNGLTGEIAIRSAGYLNGESWVWNPEAGDRVGLMRGLTLLGLTPDAPPVKLGHIDTCGYGGRQPDRVTLEGSFQTAIEANARAFGAFVIVAHNSVVCYEVDPGLEPLFAGSGLTKWRDLLYEEPYVALIAGNGEVQEFTGARQTALGVELTNIMRSPRKDAQRQLDWLPRIAHAGGALGELTYTNALEALAASAEAYELIEIDLAWTSDDQLICLYDWYAPWLSPDGQPIAPLPLAEVLARARAGAGYTPCTLETLSAILRDHPGLRIVLDLKSRAMAAYARIAETRPELLPRLVPQFYQPEDYAALRDMGYDDVIWTLYQFGGTTETVLASLRGMDLLGLVMPRERLEAGLATKARAATGVLSWVHTINSRAELDAALAMGAAEVFTDVLRPVPVVRFLARSSGFDSGESSVTRDGGAPLTLARGVNLVALEAEPTLLARFDGCAALDSGAAPDPAPFRTALTSALAGRRAVAVVVHDSAFCEGVALAPLFQDTPLTRAAGIGFRAPYVGLIRPDGSALEVTGPEATRLRQSLAVEVAP